MEETTDQFFPSVIDLDVRSLGYLSLEDRPDSCGVREQRIGVVALVNLRQILACKFDMAMTDSMWRTQVSTASKAARSTRWTLTPSG